ncbi:MAG: dihydrolipoyl dehydrogenase [Phycisphaerales bacterium]|nr:dihydrolipoyl dehydrogenase [Phycisphaerae bacterium]NNF43431.1 dihydrolipoyl dehydrogenase [Phycisphaerales bacterium]NNM24947.1 dihydrolipoyl dehydrogenase [Phycisphaerales bacterium]
MHESWSQKAATRTQSTVRGGRFGRPPQPAFRRFAGLLQPADSRRAPGYQPHRHPHHPALQCPPAQPRALPIREEPSVAKQTKHYDLIVIGSGPGGYVGAIRAAQLGLKTAVVERDKLGGVCLNWGCIPTKALLHNAELYREAITHGKEWGIEAKEVTVHWDQVIGRSRKITKTLNNGVGFLLKKNKIDHHDGHATIVSPRTGSKPCVVEVRKPAGDYYHGSGGELVETLTADRVMIATGAAPKELPFAPRDGKTVIDSSDAMNLKKQPTSMLVVGSGAIGMEFAYFYNAFGTTVTVVEMLDRILPVEDADVSKAALKAFKQQGIAFHTSTTIKSLDKTKSGVKATLVDVNDDSKTQTLEADVVLVAIGVRGRFDGLFDEKAVPVQIERDHIKTDYRSNAEPTYETSAPGIYAIGDIIGPPWLAHVASEEAVTCVERMAGHHTLGIDYDSIPGCTYCNPQIASVGLTERAAKEQGLDYTTSTYQFKAHGKAIAVGATQGFVKLITSKPYGEILGAHIIGEDASELIAEICIAKRLEATAEDIISTMHAHPTMHEGMHEAALGTEGRMIHA